MMKMPVRDVLYILGATAVATAIAVEVVGLYHWPRWTMSLIAAVVGFPMGAMIGEASGARLRRQRTPVRPQGVRIIHADGSVTPCELGYAGVKPDGCHAWKVLTLLVAGDRIHADVLPENSSIIFGITP